MAKESKAPVAWVTTLDMQPGHAWKPSSSPLDESSLYDIGLPEDLGFQKAKPSVFRSCESQRKTHFRNIGGHM